MSGRKWYELTAAQWRLIEDLFPKNEGRGRPWADHRKIVNGLFWILRSGASWRDLPERYGSWETVYYRFYLWDQDGTFDKIIERLQVDLDEDGFIDWNLWCVDGSSVGGIAREALSIVDDFVPGNPAVDGLAKELEEIMADVLSRSRFLELHVGHLK